MRLFLFLTLISAVANAEQCVSYKNTEITGTLYKDTFAGPPNYESIADGDKPETYFLVKLVKPIDKRPILKALPVKLRYC